jgi:hypothetical protein
VAASVTLDPVLCQICSFPGEAFYSDTVECNYRARRRLGIPLHVCLEHRARDLEELARRDRTRADVIAKMPPRPHNAYDDYIASAEWQAFADAQKLAARFRCEACGKPSNWDVDVHHLHYKRLGRERPQDVLVLCGGCHITWEDLRRDMRQPPAEVTVVDKCRFVRIFWKGKAA